MNLAASRNWLDCTIKLIHFCQMLIQGYMINTPNVLMLPYINYDGYRSLRDDIRNLCSQNWRELSVPVLRHLMQNKDTEQQIFNVFKSVLGGRTSEVMRTLKDLPILRVQTTVKSLVDNKIIPLMEEENAISLQLAPQNRCLFELTISREGSNKMNVYSKKFSKQKEEFWFLIFIEGDSMSFRKFSFSRKSKKIEIPVEMPPQKGKTTH